MRLPYRSYQRVYNVGFRVVVPLTKKVQVAKGAQR